MVPPPSASVCAGNAVDPRGVEWARPLEKLRRGGRGRNKRRGILTYSRFSCLFKSSALGETPLSKWKAEIFFFFFERGGACAEGRSGRRSGWQSGIRRELELRGEGGRVPALALRVGFLSPSRAGRGGAFRVPRSSKRAGAGGRGVAAAAVAGGSRLSLGSGVGDGGVEPSASAGLSVSRRRRLKN